MRENSAQDAAQDSAQDSVQGSAGSTVEVDAVIAGSGAGGGTMAWALSRAGYSVLVLEKGPRFERADYRRDGGLMPGQFTPSPETDPHLVTTRQTTDPVRTHLGWTAVCVGGGTVHMGGYFYRFHPDDFRMASRFGPVGEDFELADWPFDYAALEPYYTRAEALLGVSGQAGSNPFDGPRSGPYPLPPLDAHPIAGAIEQVCARRGLHAYPTPRSINSRAYEGRPACSFCQACASYGCPTGARGTSQEALLPAAVATGRCEVRPRSMVKEVLVDRGSRTRGGRTRGGRNRGGRARGVVYLDAGGQEHEVSARLVCVSASSVESARLLLMSRSPQHPDGLGNRHGQVGRHLQFHAVTMGRALLSPEHAAGASLRDPHPFVGRSLMDYYFLPEGVSELAKGGILRFARAPQVPEAGTLWPEHGPEAAANTLYFEGFHDFLPNEHTSVALDEEVQDPWGLPVARIQLDLPAHHRVAGSFLAERAFDVFADLGAIDGRLTDMGGTSAYLVQGSCRAGHDPRASVLDADCRVHGFDNLFVVDGSFMPTSGGAPPTLTIHANALRVAERAVALLAH